MVESQLFKLRDTSDTLIGRGMYHIVLFQDFTLRGISGLPTVRGTAGIQHITRTVFHSSIMQYLQVRYSGYTLSPRRNWLQYNCSHTLSTRNISAASITPLLSVLAARNKCTRYAEHTWNICCGASCCSCCCCLPGASAVDVPPSLAA